MIADIRRFDPHVDWGRDNIVSEAVDFIRERKDF
jgi:hypothetical protein